MLPGLGVRLNYSLELHDLGRGCEDPRCHIDKSAWQVAVSSFAPELEVPTTAAGLFAGRDEQVEAVLAEVAAGELPGPGGEAPPRVMLRARNPRTTQVIR